ncbi:MAG TPA: hypothetical protein VNM47_05080 [Terriglobia bacterium]|nr:hypothetical protein [Terriglobia bacterium]
MFLSLVALTVALCCRPASSAHAPQLVNQNEDQLAFYKNVKSYVDLSLPELISSVHELKGVQPATNEEQGKKTLAAILKSVGRNVEQFYLKFPDVTSIEQITMERSGQDGKDEARQSETFRYMAVARAGQGTASLVEYRTDMDSHPVQPKGLAQGFVVTEGFASLSICLITERQPESFFRYLGTERIDGRDTDVLAFAQRPGWASALIHDSTEGHDANLLVQGIAWIDPCDDQIVRLRLDLLAPRPDIGVMGDSIEITYAKVSFPEISGGSMWLPKEVKVTIDWKGMVHVKTLKYLPGTTFQTTVETEQQKEITYTNIHRYSHYRLFGSKSTLKY